MAPVLGAPQLREILQTDDPVLQAQQLYLDKQKQMVLNYDSPDLSNQPYLTDPQIEYQFNKTVNELIGLVKNIYNQQQSPAQAQTTLNTVFDRFSGFVSFYNSYVFPTLNKNPMFRRDAFKKMDELAQVIETVLVSGIIDPADGNGKILTSLMEDLLSRNLRYISGNPRANIQLQPQPGMFNIPPDQVYPARLPPTLQPVPPPEEPGRLMLPGQQPPQQPQQPPQQMPPGQQMPPEQPQQLTPEQKREIQLDALEGRRIIPGGWLDPFRFESGEYMSNNKQLERYKNRLFFWNRSPKDKNRQAVLLSKSIPELQAEMSKLTIPKDYDEYIEHIRNRALLKQREAQLYEERRQDKMKETDPLFYGDRQPSILFRDLGNKGLVDTSPPEYKPYYFGYEYRKPYRGSVPEFAQPADAESFYPFGRPVDVRRVDPSVKELKQRIVELQGKPKISQEASRKQPTWQELQRNLRAVAQPQPESRAYAPREPESKVEGELKQSKESEPPTKAEKQKILRAVEERLRRTKLSKSEDLTKRKVDEGRRPKGRLGSRYLDDLSSVELRALADDGYETAQEGSGKKGKGKKKNKKLDKLLQTLNKIKLQ